MRKAAQSMRKGRSTLIASLALSLAFTLAALCLAACSPTASTAGADATDGTVVTDAYGRAVTVPTDVKTVATVGSGARFVVYAGGEEGVGLLSAVTEMETQPAAVRPYSAAYAEAFAELPSTSNGNHLMETSIDAESLLALHPDVIVSSRSAAECDELQQAIGIPVVGISYQDQLFTENVYRSILAVGQAIGTSEHAQASVDALKRWSADLAERGDEARTALAQAGAPEPTVYFGAVNYKGAKSFGGTFAGYAPAQAIGAKNAADALGVSGSVEASLEQLGAWNPDFLFLNAANMGLLQSDYAANRTFFDQLAAFKTGALFSQPSFNFNGTNVELGVCDAYFIGATVYPEAFSDVDLPAMYDEVFTVLLGKPYYGQVKGTEMDFKQLAFG